jgi:hypothetical protein
MFNNFFFEILTVFEKMWEKYGTAGQTTVDNKYDTAGQATVDNKYGTAGQSTDGNKYGTAGQATDGNKYGTAGQATDGNKYGTAGQATVDNKIRRIRFAYWITKGIDTHSEYARLIPFHGNNGYANAPRVLSYGKIFLCLFPCFWFSSGVANVELPQFFRRLKPNHPEQTCMARVSVVVLRHLWSQLFTCLAQRTAGACCVC